MLLTRCAVPLLITTACLVACSAEAPSPQSPFTEPRWTRLATAGIPAKALSDLQGSAGWDRGFILAGRHYVPAEPNNRGLVNRDVPDLYVSGDSGRSWKPVLLNGLLKFGHKSPTAGYGKSAYALGATGNGAALWTTRDGTAWNAIPLPGTEPEEALSAVAAGPHGVVVVGFDRPMPSLDNDRIGNSDFGSLRIWHSADGMSFGPPQKFTITDLDGQYLPEVAATAEGFFIYGAVRRADNSMLLTSSDGVTWQNASGDFTGRPEALVQNAGTTVMFTYGKRYADREPTVWRRGKGTTPWSPSTDISVGRLPDTSVGPPTEQSVRDVAAWQGGFLASGSSSGSGAVWLSADGARWSRVPVQANGFDATEDLTVLTNRSAVLVVGNTSSSDGPVSIWRSTT